MRDCAEDIPYSIIENAFSFRSSFRVKLCFDQTHLKQRNGVLVMSYKCQLSSIITRGRQSSTFKPAPTLLEVCNAFHSERTSFKHCFVDHFNFKCAIGLVVFLGNFIGLLFTSCMFDLVIIIEHRFSYFLKRISRNLITYSDVFNGLKESGTEHVEQFREKQCECKNKSEIHRNSIKISK